MPVHVKPSDPNVSPGKTGQEFTFPAQHSRSNSVQSTATTAQDSTSTGGDGRFPDIVLRDMEFFLARLARTTSNESNESI
ncbi:hypothetical protein MFIFM68171_06831 [Madurella fahalii]|uniref:Uncharacterized protein n=1 Tax=Madurella fahalii TaxID=1157608 RepID=A0ABQ0GFS5_9PEZI